ncbi:MULTISPECIES: IPTL-CTERM sorting domain-containing protein [Comamonadaceae]|uniref:IPTL-CTERM sorting domain-containing protein n=1 Tax=Acidovorax sacchari TaxID=3230736 RepID=UPI0034A4F782
MGAARYDHTATLLANGKVLIAGGEDTNGRLAGVKLYDPTSNSWSSASSLAAARTLHAAVLLPSGKVLVVGGNAGSGGYLTSAELYDPVANSWSSAGSLGTGRSGPTATLLPSGKVLVAGGRDRDGYLASAELYDPATNSWSSAGNLTVGRGLHTATLLSGGKVLIAGGISSVYLASAELYDPATNSWSSAGSLGAARGSHTATLLSSGKVLVAGGRNPDGIASAELYDPAANSWSGTASLAAARYGHTATPLSSGKVLVAGGYGNNTLASAEQYDPATGSWSSAGSMGTARYFHTATRLSSGKVLAVAGYGNTYLSSTALYDAPAPTVPGAPTGLVASTGDGVVALSWTAPSDNGGSAITGYTVLVTPVAGGSSSVACSTNGTLGCTASGLTNGQAYSFTVRATNAVGDGSVSAAVQATPQQITSPSVPMTGVTGGGNAAVRISGAPAGCTVNSLTIDSNAPAEAPRNATFPLGVLRFTVTGCPGATLTVSITYPSAIPAAARLQKYGPKTAGAPNSWFTPSVSSISSDRLTATYQVTDNGEGDSDATPGAISDPFAPLVVPADPQSVAGIPTLSQWGLVLLSLIAAAMGMLVVRRRG